jgi:hypothetical protein
VKSRLISVFLGSKKSLFANPSWYQMLVLMRRFFVQKLREPTAVPTQILFATLLPLIIGVVFWDLSFAQIELYDRVSAVQFISTAFAILPNDTIFLFVSERNLYLQEHASGLYSTVAYFLARTLSELPVHITFTAIGSTIAYWMFGLNANLGDFLVFVIFMILTTLTAASWYQFLSSVSKTMDAANGLSMVVVAILLLFNGFYVNSNNIPGYLSWIGALSFYRYPNAAISKTQFQGQTLICPAAPATCAFPTGDDFLVYLGFQNVNVGWYAGAMVIMIVILRMLTFCGIKFCHRG